MMTTIAANDVQRRGLPTESTLPRVLERKTSEQAVDARLHSAAAAAADAYVPGMETTALEGEVRSDGNPGAVIERLAARLGSADARMIYGSPIERAGMTVIPVAKIRYGFGGGMGRKRSGGDEGSGAGGGVNVTPIGFIEMRDGKATFRRIRAPSPALIAVVCGLGAWLIAGVLRAAIAAR
jgi:hypothetical protein